MKKIKYLTRFLKEYEAGSSLSDICVKHGLYCDGCLFKHDTMSCKERMKKWVMKLMKAGIIPKRPIDWTRWETVKATWEAERKQKKLNSETSRSGHEREG